MNKKSYPITNIGSVSLIMVFIVLCMVIFTMLSLSTASADHSYSVKYSEHTSRFYDASNRAEEKLEQIDEILANTYNQNIEAKAFYDAAAAELTKLDGIEQKDGSELSYQTAIDDSHALLVGLHIFSPEEIQSLDVPAFYRITCWQEITTKKWEGNSTFNLLKID